MAISGSHATAYIFIQTNTHYKQTGHKRPHGTKDRSLIIYLLELIEEVKIGVSKKCSIALEWDFYEVFKNVYIF